jgi:hypothetical protein
MSLKEATFIYAADAETVMPKNNTISTKQHITLERPILLFPKFQFSVYTICKVDTEYAKYERRTFNMSMHRVSTSWQSTDINLLHQPSSPQHAYLW